MSKKSNDEKKALLIQKSNQVLETLPDFSKSFFNNLRLKNMSERTITQYAYDMRTFFDFLQSQNVDVYNATVDEVLDNLTIDDIMEYTNFLNTRTLDNKAVYSNPSAIARKLSCLRSFYKYYFKNGLVRNNLSDLIDIPKLPKKEIKTLKTSQITRLLEVIDSDNGLSARDKAVHDKVKLRDKAIVYLLMGTGIRVAELVSIDLDDIDFYEASITIQRKGGNDDVVYFNKDVETVLKEYINSRMKTTSPALFISLQRKRMTENSVEKMLKKYKEKAGINAKVSPHAFRRTYGTTLYNETGDIYLVAEALGHASVETTKKHYASMTQTHKRKAAAAVSILTGEKE